MPITDDFQQLFIWEAYYTMTQQYSIHTVEKIMCVKANAGFSKIDT